jgi:hypothetical protein
MLYHDNILLLIYRIISGRFIFIHNNSKYCLSYAGSDLKYQAELIYNETIDDHMFDGWVRKENLPWLLKKLDIWTSDDDETLKQTEKKIENFKLALYQNRLNKNKVLSIKKDLESYKNSFNKLLAKKHSLDYITLEEYANNKKNEFIYINSITDFTTGELIFDRDFNNIEYHLFIEITNEIANHFITIEQYKQIARHESWKTIYKGNQYNIFNRPASELTDEQKSLLNISAMYDRIYEHHEAPEENIIQDDDMLEGWMIYQKRKAEQANKENKSQDILSKHNNAKEIYIVGDSEDIDDIYTLNSTQSSKIMQQRKRTILNSPDGVDEVNLPDIQSELLQKVNSIRK